jgi:hypothetical protein
MEGAQERDHRGFPAFWVAGGIFCTLRDGPPRLMVNLDPEDQRNLCLAHRLWTRPAAGKWGASGSTFIDFAAADGSFVEMVLRVALERRQTQARRSRT